MTRPVATAILIFATIAAIVITSRTVAAKEGSRSLQALNSEMDVCYNFTQGDRNKGEFYSPFYPNNYPNNTECIALITAPFGSFIRVEFRDQFHLEDSQTCEYDRLEIRNGQFGYSDLIDIICGHNFPQEISSTDRYLWLRFKSDESIEYSGFRAVYHFVPLPTTRPEPPSCYFEKSGASGYIRSSEIPEEVFNYSETYKTPLECIWNITVQQGWKMYVNFENYQLVKPNDCDVNYIDIYESVLSEEKRKARFCGTTTEPQKSDGSVINIRFHAKEGVIDVNQRKNFQFDILFTAFRQSDKDKCNAKTEFDCDDGTCIDISLKCNGAYNCKYRYDEDAATTCLKGGKGVLILTSEHMIIILIVFFLLVIGMCASIIVSCWGKIQERRQRELEYKMRRSREVSVEQGLDRTVTVTSLDRNMGAEFATLPAVLGQRNPKLGDTIGPLMRSSREDDESCYVPDMDLDYGRKGGSGPLIDDKYSPATPPVGPAESCPLYLHHQQRDSLRSGSEDPDDIPPPPPPPSISHFRGRHVLDNGPQDLSTPSPTDNHQMQHRPECAQHGGGDYRAQSLGHGRSLDDQNEDMLDDENLVPLSTRAQSMRFRAEAVIEMGSGPSMLGGRPRSFAELRSAPDVVVLR